MIGKGVSWQKMGAYSSLEGFAEWRWGKKDPRGDKRICGESLRSGKS